MVIRLFVAALLIVFAASPGWAILRGSGGASGPECSVATDYIGLIDTTPDTGAGLVSDRMYVQPHAPVCASGCATGQFKTPKLYHDNSHTDVAKVCLYSDNGTVGVRESSDLLIECIELTGAGFTTTISGADFNEPVTCGNNYWLAVIASPTEWYIGWNDGTAINAAYRDSVGSFTIPPANLGNTYTPVSGRQISMYTTIGN